jgi:hypothetical protein
LFLPLQLDEAKCFAPKRFQTFCIKLESISPQLSLNLLQTGLQLNRLQQPIYSIGDEKSSEESIEEPEEPKGDEPKGATAAPAAPAVPIGSSLATDS